MKKEYNIDQLYDLAAALAGTDTTVLDCLPLCEQLWSDSDHRTWLTAAMICKMATPHREPDTGCEAFLSQKIYDALHQCGFSGLPDPEQIAEVLEAVILLMPAEVWDHPERLWMALLEACRSEFDLNNGQISQATDEISQEAAEAAGLFVEAIGKAWTTALDEKLEMWRDRPEYSWLAALRNIAKLETLLHVSAFPVEIDHPDFFDQFVEMTSFQKSQILVLKQPDKNRVYHSEPDPKIDTAISTIEWKFKIPLENSVSLQLIIAQRMVGGLTLSRSPHENLQVQKATGLCQPLAGYPVRELELRRAAATENVYWTPITQSLSCALEPAHASVVIHFRSHYSEKSHD